jgi:hypothetical protein
LKPLRAALSWGDGESDAAAQKDADSAEEDAAFAVDYAYAAIEESSMQSSTPLSRE